MSLVLYYVGTRLEVLGEGDGGDDDKRNKIPEHPSPILRAPRNNISHKGNPSLRYIHIYIYIYIWVILFCTGNQRGGVTKKGAWGGVCGLENVRILYIRSAHTYTH